MISVSAAFASCAGNDTTTIFGVAVEQNAPSPPVAANGVALPPAAGPEPSAATDAGLPLGACGESAAAYEFSSRFVPDAGVSYAGAVSSHVSIAELGAFIDELTARLDGGARYGRGELVAALDVYLKNPENALDPLPLSLRLAGEPALRQVSHADVAPGQHLLAKLAGSDAVTAHAAWATPGVFAGWRDLNLGRPTRTSVTPEGFVSMLSEQLEINVTNRALGFLQRGPALDLLPVSVMRNGRDLGELLRAFLIGAVAFAQGTDVELDADVEGRGLLAPFDRVGSSAQNGLEQAWDAAFGYFGAARDYKRCTEGEPPVSNHWYDTNGDASIDLQSEVSFGAARYAAERAWGPTAPDFGAAAFEAFVAGRSLIAQSEAALSREQTLELDALATRAIEAWEDALAATVIHDLNQVHADTGFALAASADYVFVEHARHWSELKGLALAFQFNPRSRLSASNFAALHELVADAPTVPDTLPPTNTAELAQYQANLITARTLLAQAFDLQLSAAATW